MFDSIPIALLAMLAAVAVVIPALVFIARPYVVSWTETLREQRLGSLVFEARTEPRERAIRSLTRAWHHIDRWTYAIGWIIIAACACVALIAISEPRVSLWAVVIGGEVTFFEAIRSITRQSGTGNRLQFRERGIIRMTMNCLWDKVQTAHWDEDILHLKTDFGRYSFAIDERDIAQARELFEQHIGASAATNDSESRQREDVAL